MRLRLRKLALAFVVAPILYPASVHAEDGSAAWLRYTPLARSEVAAESASLPNTIVSLDDSPLAKTAQAELVDGLTGMLAHTPHTRSSKPVADALANEDAILLGTAAQIHRALPSYSPAPLIADGYELRSVRAHGHTYLLVVAANSRGLLYGTFALLSRVARIEDIAHLHVIENPSAPIRWVDQWDNLDGSIERGYAGRSIFFEQGSVRADLTRAGAYARLLASVGINGVNVNNVNANPRALAPDFLAQLTRIADAFRPWGVRLSLSVGVNSPQTVGELNSFDPLDPRVAQWWRDKVDEIYARIPDFAGFTIKADSEGQPGPSSYGRTPADAANVVARALRPHGGVLLYRTFVYNHHLDWRDSKADRARAAYDIFRPLDGRFDDNVILQIKHGPIDFQAREPVSPLLGALARTNEAIELQVTQEYTGQQRHLCFLVPMWKEVLDFDLHANDSVTPVKALVSGRIYHRPLAGFVAVANVGLDANWLAHPLAMANLYGFARLAWNPNLSAATIVDEWTRLTFGNDPAIVSIIRSMQLASWHIYESYTGPLGAGTLTDILGVHYGPGIESSERNGWGQWHRADHEGIGMDRTVATGTGFIGQYNPPVRAIYESLQLCPDALLLFMHHVRYTYRLHSGETVIQHIYDSHYEGAAAAAHLVTEWQSLRGRIDDQRYRDVLARLEYQQGHAIVWRDAICDWFLRTSGIPDTRHRAGHHPGRIEAESMHLDGYSTVAVTPWETASGGKAISCSRGSACTASFKFDEVSGQYTLAVQYFDLNHGTAKFDLRIDGKSVTTWVADNDLPSGQMNGHTSTRRTLQHLDLHKGATIEIRGKPDQDDRAAVDYIEIKPEAAPSHHP